LRCGGDALFALKKGNVHCGRCCLEKALTTVPKAYINYIFFDEQFKFVSGNFSRV
jgi:hypothetical protein